MLHINSIYTLITIHLHTPQSTRTPHNPLAHPTIHPRTPQSTLIPRNPPTPPPNPPAHPVIHPHYETAISVPKVEHSTVECVVVHDDAIRGATLILTTGPEGQVLEGAC